MQQLRGMDASFLSMESEQVHLHTLKVLVFSRGRPPTVEQIEATSHLWLDQLPSLRRRVVELPLGLGQPVFVEDESFDLHRHFDSVTFFSPAGQRQLDQLVSQIASRPLERDRPLWQVTLVDGLEKGRWAAVLKIHHALADGAAAVTALSRTLSGNLLANWRDFGQPRPALLEPVPSRWRLLQLGLLSLFRSLALIPGLLLQTLRGLRAVRLRRHNGAQEPAKIFDTEVRSFNHAVSGRRIFATTQLSLDRLRLLKRRAGVTLNDVVLAVTSGALRRFLIARGEAPNKALVASVPVGLNGETYVEGNRVSSIFAGLPANEADPTRRLAAIHQGMTAAKQELALGNIDSQRWTEVLPPSLLAWGVRIARRLRLSERFRPPINLIVSNVRGPRSPLSAGPHGVEEIYSVGPLLGAVGLNVTVWSYANQLFVSLLASPDLTPDLEELSALFAPALAELEDAYALETAATGQVA